MFFFFFFLMTDGDSITINYLRMSPTPLEFTNDTEFNDEVPSNFIDFQDSLVHYFLRQTTTWMMMASHSLKFTEITPIAAVQKV